MRHMPFAVVVAATLGGCSAGASSFYVPFGTNPQPPARVASVGVSVPPQQPLPVVTTPTGDKPTMIINAPVNRVQDAIVRRAQQRGTTVVGVNQTGVTLERALTSSPPVLENNCGPHQQGRSVRIYLATQGDGARTVVTEERFVIDPGPKVCSVVLPAADIAEANKSLADLKQQSEAPRTAAAPRNTDPSGGPTAVNPGRPVVPLR
ncbi:MAG: hypothetical protein ACRCWF_08760 [Beijerinckiaceae bacterium]